MRTISDRRRRTSVILAVACAGLAMALLAPPAAGQQGPGYGSTSTTRRPPRTATIEITPTTGPSGTRVSVNACGYTPGTAGGSITFGGAVVASGLIAGSDGCLKAGGSQPTFIVPQTRPGTHQVCAVVAGYNTPCARFRVENRGAEVLGAEISREGPRVLGVTLPRTGVYVGLLVAIGVALLIVGRVLLSRSRRRREAERAALEASPGTVSTRT